MGLKIERWFSRRGQIKEKKTGHWSVSIPTILQRLFIFIYFQVATSFKIKSVYLLCRSSDCGVKQNGPCSNNRLFRTTTPFFFSGIFTSIFHSLSTLLLINRSPGATVKSRLYKKNIKIPHWVAFPTFY